jgi:hypothetical protein
VSRTDDVAAIVKAFGEHDFALVERLRLAASSDTRAAADDAIAAMQPVEWERRDREVEYNAFLEARRPGMLAADAIADLTADELLELSQITRGDDE